MSEAVQRSAGMNKNKGIVLYLHVHQPWRIREYSIFDVAWKHNYFSGDQNPDQDNQKNIPKKVAEKVVFAE